MNDGEYPNHPRVAVGVVVIHQDRVLMVRRGKQPSIGQWAIPGGSVELGETLKMAAERESLEETGVLVKAAEILHTFEDIRWDGGPGPRFHYVIVDLAARYIRGDPVGLDDAAAARWFSKADIAGLNVNTNTLALLQKIGFLGQ